MGTFRIEIQAVGGHGDAREIGDGGTLDPASYPDNSIDAVAFDALQALQARGASVESAKLIHWPGDPGQVVDDLLTRTRTCAIPGGAFGASAQPPAATTEDGSPAEAQGAGEDPAPAGEGEPAADPPQPEQPA